MISTKFTYTNLVYIAFNPRGTTHRLSTCMAAENSPAIKGSLLSSYIKKKIIPSLFILYDKEKNPVVRTPAKLWEKKTHSETKSRVVYQQNEEG